MKRPVITETEDLITPEAVAGSSAKLVPAGSVLCVMRSGILRHSFPVAVGQVEVTLNQDMRALVPTAEHDPRFVAYYLRRAAWDILGRCSKGGTTVNSIEASLLDAYPVPVPPIDVQRRIVRRVDDLFAELDDGQAALIRARDDLETYRKSVLKAAVTGELTADWREANPYTMTGEQLLQCILADRKARWEADPKNRGKRYKEPPKATSDSFPVLPEGWVWASVAQLGEVITGATPKSERSEFYGGNVPFYTPGDLDQGYQTKSSKRTITDEGLGSVRAIPAGSVMVTCIGATIGKTGVNRIDGATNQQINTIIPAHREYADFLYLFFSGIGQREVVDRSSSTTLPILNKGDFSEIPVPLPPLLEAQEAAKRAMQLLAEADDLGDHVQHADQARLLRQAILTTAFRGELVQ